MAWYEGIVAKEQIWSELCSKIEASGMWTVHYQNTVTSGNEWKWYKSVDAANIIIGLRARDLAGTGTTYGTFPHILVQTAEGVDSGTGTVTNPITTRPLWYANGAQPAGLLVQYWLSVLPTAIILVVNGDPALGTSTTKQNWAFAGRTQPFYAEAQPWYACTAVGSGRISLAENPNIATAYSTFNTQAYFLDKFDGSATTANQAVHQWSRVDPYGAALGFKGDFGDFQLHSMFYGRANFGLRGEFHLNIKYADNVSTNMANYDEVTLGADTYKFFVCSIGFDDAGTTNVPSGPTWHLIVKKA